MKTTTTTVNAVLATPSLSLQPLARQLRNVQKSSVTMILATFFFLLITAFNAHALIRVCVKGGEFNGCHWVFGVTCQEARDWAAVNDGVSIKSCAGFKPGIGTVITLKGGKAYLTVKGERLPLHDKLGEKTIPRGFVEKVSKEFNIPIVKDDIPPKEPKKLREAESAAQKGG